MRYFSKEEIFSYNDEDKLTEQVIFPLFEAVADYYEGVYEAGAWLLGKDKREEGNHGMDILFGYHDFWGAAKHSAVLCKAIKITMGVSSSKPSSILTIENQIKLAWGAGFVSPLNHKPSVINNLILVTNKEIMPAVYKYTWGLENEKYRNVDLWGITKLYNLVKRYSRAEQRK